MTIPSALQDLFAGSAVEDKSYSKTAKTFRLTRREGAVFVKLASVELLERERLMSEFLHQYGLAPEVLGFGPADEGAYLVTAALKGADGVAPGHLGEPSRLAVVYGESLRQLHELAPERCPVRGRDDELRRLAEASLASGDYDPGHIPEPLPHAAASLRADRPHDDQVVLHGDYCLPNILLDGFRLSGFVDLGNGGVGGRHYDLYWGVWALEYNLKSNAYKDLFLDAYGRDRYSAELLDYNRILSGLT
jgi:kanamycin kinase